MASMRAAFVAGPRRIEVRDVERPEAGPGRVLLRVRGCGICGSDLHFYRGEFPAPPGMCPGHEISGEVTEVGEGVSGWSPGDRVAVEPLIVCRTCDYCRTGRHQLCAQRRLLGTQVPGGLAEYLAVPAYTLYRLPADMDFALGALVEPVAVSVHGLRLVDLRAGERVAVLGAGSIGLVTAVVARALGAADVAITARHPQQRALAESLGARVFPADDEGAAALQQEAARSGFDVVVETVGGTAPTLQQAVALAAPGGRVSVLGLFTGPVSFNPTPSVLKEVSIVGSITYGMPHNRPDFGLAVDIVAAHGEALGRLITHRFPLERAGDAFETAADKSSGSAKVSVVV